MQWVSHRSAPRNSISSSSTHTRSISNNVKEIAVCFCSESIQMTFFFFLPFSIQFSLANTDFHVWMRWWNDKYAIYHIAKFWSCWQVSRCLEFVESVSHHFWTVFRVEKLKLNSIFFFVYLFHNWTCFISFFFSFLGGKEETARIIAYKIASPSNE